MTDTLTTAVVAAIDRIVLMEPLAVTDADMATKAWHYINPAYPYFTNRCAGLTNPSSNRWVLSVEARLILVHIGAANNPDADSNTPQDNAWEYIPAMIRYFEQYNTLDPPDVGEVTYNEIQYLDTEGVSITCPGGTRDAFNPYTGASTLYISFDLTVPFLIFE